MEERIRWIVRIKGLRKQHNASIFEAERIALADPQWRRWAELQINTDTRCRQMALDHIRSHGEAALIEHYGNSLKVR